MIRDAVCITSRSPRDVAIETHMRTLLHPRTRIVTFDGYALLVDTDTPYPTPEEALHFLYREDTTSRSDR